MQRSKILLIVAILLLPLAAGVSVNQGTEINPTGSNAIYVIGQDMNFSSITVYNTKVNLSNENVTTTAANAVKVTIWKHNFTGNPGTELKYHYNRSATTNIYGVDSSEIYDILKNGSTVRSVTGQQFINLTVAGNTNVTINNINNNAPNSPSNPSPSDGSTGTSTSPQLSVDVSDPDAGSLNVSFYNAANDNRIGFQQVSSGSTATVTWNGLSTGTTYNWYANATDTYDVTMSSTFSFTTNYPVDLVSDSQFYTNYSTNHEFAVEAYANDTDGEADITTCTVDYSAPGGSGTVSGTIDTSYGNANEVKCSANISDSLSGVDVGETVTTSMNFYDGVTWANTSNDNNPVPNNAPTLPGSKTDLSMFVADHTPPVQWLGEADPDGDSMTIELYTGTGSTPTTLDSSGSTGLSSLDLGNSVTLTDNTTYYYRIKICDNYNLCSAYGSSDQFRMNEEPLITDYSLNKTSPTKGDTLYLNATVKDPNLDGVNFTVWEGNTRIVNQNGTWNGDFWQSPQFLANESTVYNYTITAIDNSSETSSNYSSFNTGYEKSGKYFRTFTTAKQVTSIKPTVYGNFSGGSLTIKVNSSADSSPNIVENNTWLETSAGQDFTLIFEIQSDGTTPLGIDSYTVDYKTDYKSPGAYKSQAYNLSYVADITDIDIVEKQPGSTDLTYEFRSGNSSTPDGTWTGWNLCDASCDPGLPESQYIQFRANLTGGSQTPELNSLEINYE